MQEDSDAVRHAVCSLNRDLEEFIPIIPSPRTRDLFSMVCKNVEDRNCEKQIIMIGSIWRGSSSETFNNCRRSNK